MEGVLKGMLDAVVKSPNGRLSTRWKEAVNGVLDAYLGKVPDTFTYQGKSYTARSFADMLGLKADDYVAFTSFTHHPFYQPFMVEVPDNWAAETAWNLPLDEFGQVIEGSLQNGYSVAWAADVSEKFISHKSGVAVVPDKNLDQLTDEDRTAFFAKPVKQKKITPELRQLAFDNYETQDDHGMHFVGLAKDQDGTRYYIVKNSWGTDRNDIGGIFYASDAYVLYKTTFVLVNKKSLPKAIAAKLKLS
jgi:bleomycin hydrolase